MHEVSKVSVDVVLDTVKYESIVLANSLKRDRFSSDYQRHISRASGLPDPLRLATDLLPPVRSRPISILYRLSIAYL